MHQDGASTAHIHVSRTECLPQELLFPALVPAVPVVRWRWSRDAFHHQPHAMGTPTVLVPHPFPWGLAPPPLCRAHLSSSPQNSGGFKQPSQQPSSTMPMGIGAGERQPGSSLATPFSHKHWFLPFFLGPGLCSPPSSILILSSGKL